MNRLPSILALAGWTAFAGTAATAAVIGAASPWLAADGALPASPQPAGLPTALGIGLLGLACAGAFGTALARFVRRPADADPRAERFASAGLFGMAATALLAAAAGAPVGTVAPLAPGLWTGLAAATLALLFDRLVTPLADTDDEADFQAGLGAIAARMARSAAGTRPAGPSRS